MSDFWDNLGQVLNDAAYRAVKASGNAVELTKITANIKLDDIKRDNLLKEIGRLVYDGYKADPDGACAEIEVFCKCIDEIEVAICEKKAKAAELKNKKYCASCGTLIDKFASYCYSCGAKQPEIAEECCEDEPPCCCGDEPEPCGDSGEA